MCVDDHNENAHLHAMPTDVVSSSDPLLRRERNNVARLTGSLLQLENDCVELPPSPPYIGKKLGLSLRQTLESTTTHKPRQRPSLLAMVGGGFSGFGHSKEPSMTRINLLSPTTRAFTTTSTLPSPPRSPPQPLSFSHNSTRPPITSPRNSPPPDFLLDDDPFANLTACATAGCVGRQSGKQAEDRSADRSPDTVGIGSSATMQQPHPTTSSSTRLRKNTTPSRSNPTSPSQTTFTGGLGMRSSFPSIGFLSESNGWASSSTSQPPPPPTPAIPPTARSHHSPSSASFSHHRPSPSSPHITQPHRPSPAHQRPAFKSRPSLPSLNTLAKMNFVPGASFGVRKVRKGKVGAGLPFEPWNNLHNSSGETSPVLEEDGDEIGGAFASGSISVKESTSTSLPQLNPDSVVSMSSPPSPTHRYSASSITTLTPSPTLPSPSVHVPPNVSLAPTSSALTAQPLPLGQKPLLPSQILALGPEVGVVYAESRSPPRSPTLSAAPHVSMPLPPPQLISRSSEISSTDISAALETDPISAFSGMSIDGPLEFGLDSYSRPDSFFLAPRHDEVPAGRGSIVDEYNDGDVDDVDRFMDQFMDHYDRLDPEEDQRDDVGRLGLQEEDDVLLGKVDKRMVINEDEIETLGPRSPTSPPEAVSTATSLTEMAHTISFGSRTISDMPTSPLPDNAVLAPTLRMRTRPRPMRMINIAVTNMDDEVDDPSHSDSYSYPYTFPYPSLPASGGEVESSPSVPASSPSGLTPPVSATDSRWSPISRSRSLSSTYTTLSFESESEVSSCPRSSSDGDDEAYISLYNNSQPLPQNMQPPKSAMDTGKVSVIGSPPPLSMPFSGSEDTGYIVSVPSPGSIPPPVILHGSLSSSSSHTDDELDDFSSNISIASTTTRDYSHYHVDEDRVPGEEFDSRQALQHTAGSKPGAVTAAVVMGNPSAEEKDGMESEEDAEAELGHEDAVEWEYVVGGGEGDCFRGMSNGGTFGHDRTKTEDTEETIAIVTSDTTTTANYMNLITQPPTTTLTTPTTTPTTLTTPTTTLATPTMTQFVSTSILDADDMGSGSSTALAMSAWKQDICEGGEVEGGKENGNGSYSSSYKSGGSPIPSYSPTHKSNGSVYDPAIPSISSNMDSSPFEWKVHNRTGNDGDDGGRRAAPAGRMNQSSFLAISPESSDSSDDGHYGPANSSPSQSLNVRAQQHFRPNSVSAMPESGGASPSASLPAARRGRVGRSEEDDDLGQASNSPHDDGDDDDVPLAKRIPGALTAQKSIRYQVRQEREQRKREKLLKGQAGIATTGLMTSRLAVGVPSTSSSHDDQRQRTQTLTGKGSSMPSSPFSPEDLARKLRDVNGWDGGASSSLPIGAATTVLYQQHSRHRSKSMSRSSGDVHPSFATEALPAPMPRMGSPISSHAQRTKSMKEPSPSPIHPAHGLSTPTTTLRTMRSFHRPRPSTDHRPIGMDDPRSVPLPLDAEQRISRSFTRSRPSTRDGPAAMSPTAMLTPHHHHQRSLSHTRSSIDRTSPMTIPEPVPPVPIARISHDEHRKLLKAPHHYESPSSSSSRAGPTRGSVDHQHRSGPAPSTSSPADLMTSISKPELVVQQRVFISDMQRFNMVAIGASTTAGDVIHMIKAEGSLKGFATGSGGWMVFEVAQDFGMERPIRSFELVADVQASWNKDKMVNYLVLRLTPLDVPLNRSAIPSSSPTHSGYVEWEVKRGKWSKRWMQLREHSIWLSKRDNGRDQVQLCSLSNFDAYKVTRSHRAPKPFAFAVKSTDKLSFFENTADYLHSFACSEKDGKVWMEKILVARSYVLFQERHVLFNPKAVVNGNNAGGLSRAGTRKATIQRPAVVQPLLSLPPPPPFGGVSPVFEPGSLLSKQF